MSSYFLKNYLKLWFLKYGSFANVNKSSVSDLLEKEFSESKFTNLYDFTFNCIGYANDYNLSPYKRYIIRRESMINISNPSYWKEQSNKLNEKRTSEVVETFKYLEVQGLGKEYVSIQSSKYYFPNFLNFIQSNKELVDVFCKGIDLLDSRLTIGEGSALKVSTILKYLVSTSSKDFEKKAKKLGTDFSNVFHLVESPNIKVTSKAVFLPKKVLSEYDSKFIQKCLMYSAIMKCDEIPLTLMDHFVNYLPKCINLFNLGVNDYLSILDLGFMVGKPVNELLNLIGFDLPDPDTMMKMSRGIYILSGSNVNYIPQTLEDQVASSCVIELEEFCNLVNHDSLSEIVYKLGIPYLWNSILK